MKLGTWKAWLLVLAFVLPPQPAEAGAGQYSIQFREHLKVSNDLKLTGTRHSSSIRFTCESAWKPVSGGTLHLFIDHSPDIDGSRSFLSVTLNYGVLRSLRLDDYNQSITQVTIPLPAEMLRPENELVFSVEQFPGTRHSNEIWTAIKPASFITIRYEETRPASDLRLLPSPLVDPRSYRPQQLSVLLPAAPSSETLEATALLIANYARGLREALTVHTVDSIDARSANLLIAGTPEEQPQLRLLEDTLPFGVFRIGNKTQLGMNPENLFAAEEGIVALAQKTGRAFSPILLVTGNGPQAISKAARKLIGGHFDGAGTFARISEDARAASLPARAWAGFLPPENHFSLAQMGLKELTIDSANDFVLSLPLFATPDAQFLEYGHQVTLEFRFDSGAGIENTTLEVDLNGSVLGRFDAAELSTWPRASVHLKIPARLLRRENVLRMSRRGVTSAAGSESAAWLLPTSEFDLPRDYRSGLPDLGLLQHGLFPFGLRQDFSDTIILLPDDSGKEVTAAVFELAAIMGRVVPAHRLAFGVKHERDLTREARMESHIIALRIGKLPKGSVAAVQETISPWNAQKCVLSITSNSASGLRAGIRTLFSEDTFRQLHGDTTYIYSDKLASFQTAPVRQIYEYSYFTHLQAWLRENWIALPVILTTVSCLLFVGLRLALVQYKSSTTVAAFYERRRS